VSDKLNTCDDCGVTCPGAIYYSLDPETCSVDPEFNEPAPHEGCTGNLGPECAGPFLVPDQPDDPRRPLADDPNARAAMDVLIAHVTRP
jgi:hypothetical protein